MVENQTTWKDSKGKEWWNGWNEINARMGNGIWGMGSVLELGMGSMLKWNGMLERNEGTVGGMVEWTLDWNYFQSVDLL